MVTFIQGSRDSRRQTSDTEWDSDVHLSDNDVSMEDSDSDWQNKFGIRRTNSGTGRNTHKSFITPRKMKSSNGLLTPRARDKTADSKSNHALFDANEHTPVQVSKSALGQSERCANAEEPFTPERQTSNEFQGSIPSSYEIAQLEQSPGDGGDRRLSLVGILDEVEAGARRAERAMAAERAALAAQAAALLDSAFLEASPMRERGGHLGSGEESEGERIRRRPLSDLGNIKVIELSLFISVTL